MNEEFKQLETEIKWLTDTVDANLEKQYNHLKTMSNKELRKEIENANWSYILQIIRYSQAKIEQLQQENKQLKEIFDKVIDKLGKYAIVIRSNGEAYTICVDLLDILKEVSE